MGGDWQFDGRGCQTKWRGTLMGRDKILVRGDLSKFWLAGGGGGGGIPPSPPH